MRNPLNKKYLLFSFILHVAAVFLVGFSYRDTSIKKTFVAYGRHSKRITHAYFRQLKARPSQHHKYIKARNIRRKTKTAKKKSRPKKKAPPKKKKTTPKIVERKKKKPVVKKSPPKKAPPKKKPKAKPKQEQKPKKQPEEEIEEEEEFLHFNLMGESDPRVIMYQQCIQAEVDRVWRPPLGVPKGTECIVLFSIGKNGSVEKFEITKSSKVVIYDLSIVRVAKTFKFDRCLWGKSFVVDFRQ